MSAIVAEATPDSAGWKLLTVRVVDLGIDDTITVLSATDETALVLISGSIRVRLGKFAATISRQNVFAQLADLVYAPPGTAVEVEASGGAQIALGQAPAMGIYPPRIITTTEMRGVIRGGGPARRQVMSPLAGTLPAERLLVYEGWVPRGSWTGWPPHRHDGFADSPKLEETYYYRFDRPSGFGFHRNYRPGS